MIQKNICKSVIQIQETIKIPAFWYIKIYGDWQNDTMKPFSVRLKPTAEIESIPDENFRNRKPK